MPVRLDRLAEIAVIVVDNPPDNALSGAVREGLKRRLDDALADPDVQAIALAADGRGFIAGAEVGEAGAPAPPSDAPDLSELAAAFESASKPVVAALHGVALGGGFELSLACAGRVAAADARLGLPDVKLGVIPGAGGTQRLPRLAGIAFALDAIVSGRAIGAAEALKAGVIDAVAADDLRLAACARARELIGAPPRRTRDLRVPAFDAAEVDAMVAERRRKARGALAPQAAAEAVARAAATTFDQGVAEERATFLRLAESDQAKASRYAFFAEREVIRSPRHAGVTPRPVASVGVVGAGAMGAGIAIAVAAAGLPVVLVDAAQDALTRARERMRATWARDVALGRIDAARAADHLDRVRAATQFERLAACDVIIEAAFEEMAVKTEIFARLAPIAKPGAILASNTSYLDLDAIARAGGRAADVIGLHFFAPANVMRLVEVVDGAASAPDAVAAGVALARRIGKLPVVTGVCEGFVGNRILNAWRTMADMAVEDGAWPHEIDAAMEAWGMAMGGFAVRDLSGLDIGMRRRRDSATRRDPAARDAGAVADRLCEMGRFGQKSGAGYYRYVEGRRDIDPLVTETIREVSARKGIARRSISGERVMTQIHATMVNEACRILDEGVVTRPIDVDQVLLHGYGFPVWRGGPLFEADRRGLDRVLDVVREVAGFAGKGYEPAPLLEAMARRGTTFAQTFRGRETARS